MRILLLLSACILFACRSKEPISEKKVTDQSKVQDSLRVHFMRMESNVYGDFVQLRRFHLDLMQEIESTGVPYLEMDSVFHLLHVEADSVIIQRLHFDAKEYQKVDELLARVQYHNVMYSFWKVRYEQLKGSNNIGRYSLRHFSEIINSKIELWYDSLEIAGSAMAKAKMHLKNSGLNTSDKVYIQRYQPISLMELDIKKLQASIMQLQNAESRFSDANAEEYYYTGPNIRPRREIVATEGILSEIVLHMADIRTAEKTYYNQYK